VLEITVSVSVSTSISFALSSDEVLELHPGLSSDTVSHQPALIGRVTSSPPQ
jgi:hypothetical protein